MIIVSGVKNMRRRVKDNLRKIRDIYCFGNFFLNRGIGLFSSVYQIVKYTAFAGIIVGMINEAFGIHIPMDKVIFFTPILVILLIAMGVIDVKKIHALQKSNEISTRYNPYLVELITNSKNKKQ